MKYFPLAIGLAVVFLAGCSSSEQTDLASWISEERQKSYPKPRPINPPVKFIPVLYDVENLMEPFNREKLTRAFVKEGESAVAGGALIAFERARRKEALEAFPLDVMAMVGSLDKENSSTALLRVDKLLYQVKEGNHIGQNYGRITKITETEIILREVVQDSAGDWVERTATLQLQEQEGSK